MNFGYWPKNKKSACSLKGDRMRTYLNQEVLGVEALLPQTERRQLRWLGHLYKIPHGSLPGEVSRECLWNTLKELVEVSTQRWKWKDRCLSGWLNGWMIIGTLVWLLWYSMCLFMILCGNMNSKSNDWVILLASFHPVLHQSQQKVIYDFYPLKFIVSTRSERGTLPQAKPATRSSQESHHWSRANWNSDMCCGVPSHHKS